MYYDFKYCIKIDVYDLCTLSINKVHYESIFKFTKVYGMNRVYLCIK